MSDLGRRDFLKFLGLLGAAATTGCPSEPAKTIIPYVIPPEELVPGEATWYATTCRECPAGCGLLAKNRDGRIIKVEGNPLHPINLGRLCPRGQASVQGIYDPDRRKGPLKKTQGGRVESISWEEGEHLLVEKLSELIGKGRGEKIVFLSGLISGTLQDLVLLWLSQMGSNELLQYEPYAYEPLRRANQIVFGVEAIPTYHIDRADFLISFGADFLETWLSNVEYARQFGAFRTPRGKEKPLFISVGPRLSLTGANGDHWISVPPGCEVLVALGMLRVMVDEHLVPGISPELKAILKTITQPWSLEQVAQKTNTAPAVLQMLGRRFAAAKSPLALAAGLSSTDAHATELAVAVNLLCSLMPGTQGLIDFGQRSSLTETAKAGTLKELGERMRRGDVDLLLIHNANPVFSVPPSWELDKAIQSVPMVVSFSTGVDETSELAHLCLPSPTSFEAWGDFEPRKGVRGLLQPVMGPLFNTRPLGDLLIASGQKLKDPKMFPWRDLYDMLRNVWALKGRRRDPNLTAETFWQEALKRGGLWDSAVASAWKPVSTFPGVSFPTDESYSTTEKGLHLLLYPTIQFFDGRGANRPWLQELPDPMTNITWDNWVELHPETAKKRGILQGDLLLVKSPHGTLEVPAYLNPGVHPSTLALPLGQGHTHNGRFAMRPSQNPMRLLPAQPDTISGGLSWSVSGVDLEKMKKRVAIAHTDGSLSQHSRGIAQAMALDAFLKAKASGQKPFLRLPLSEANDPKDDLYAPHPHGQYRWAMTVDLDRCIGCGACVVACYAENNVAVVGKEQILKGREMSWLRIERFFEKEEPWVRFIPMLCQHCDHAPCEPVCPVFAAHHSKEGLNNQVYNRCIGTRYCSQNCPYKVRRFNWFTFLRPEPLNWQLNPDVTVRQKGVMEKCSFCIQRIVKVKNVARNEGREIREGEVQPACVQTCPTEALSFGNLLDPRSRISALVQNPRAYQVFVQLNTKPAVIYLKKLTQTMEG